MPIALFGLVNIEIPLPYLRFIGIPIKINQYIRLFGELLRLTTLTKCPISKHIFM